ncbi:MAG: hypothetical protein ACJAVR_003739 [Paracoccaceae bacterium]|jgi:hypothetical protein
MMDGGATARVIGGFSPADLQLTAAAALLAIAIIAIVLLRARFPGKLVHGRSRPRRVPARVLSGRCRWHARPDLNDKDLNAWSCANCKKVRWTSSRSQPPEPCR